MGQPVDKTNLNKPKHYISWRYLALLTLLFLLLLYLLNIGISHATGFNPIRSALKAAGLQGPAGQNGLNGIVGQNGKNGTNGVNGTSGQAGANGSNGSQGEQGIPGSNDCIAGICVSRQVDTPGTQETGNINIDGAIIAASLAGDGSNLTGLDASNVSSGILNVAMGGTGLNGSAATNGQLLIGNGSGYSLSTITAGAGISVTNGAGSITIANTGAAVACDITSAYVCNGGNTLAATLTIGTNDSQELRFETNGSDRLTIQTDGDVGIGTTSPLDRLDVANGHIVLSGTGSRIRRDVDNSSIALLGATAKSLGAYFQASGDTHATTPGVAEIITKGTGSLRVLNAPLGSSSTTELFRVTSTGSVGIGDTTPDYLLDVAGTLGTDGIITAGAVGTADNSTYLCRNSSNQIATCNSSGAGAAFVQGGNTFGATATLGTNDANSLVFETNNQTAATIASGGAVTFQNNTDTTSGLRVMDADGGTPIFNVDTTNERVGIGTATPSAELHVTAVGNTTVLVDSGFSSNLIINRGATTNYNSVRLQTGGTTHWAYGLQNDATDNFFIGSGTTAFDTATAPKFVIQPDGDVGIGTSVPGSKLTIEDAATNGSITNSLRIYQTGTGTGTGTGIELGYGGSSTNTARIAGIYDGSGRALAFSTGTGAAAYSERMRIDNAGNVGIGDSTPDFMLDVAGTLGTDGIITAGAVGSADTNTILCRNSSNQIATCSAGGLTLQDAYDGGNTITTTDGRNISITLADTTTDQVFEITQAGTALALRVNDDGIFTDSTPFVIDASGNVGIGTETPTYALHTKRALSTDGTLAFFEDTTSNVGFGIRSNTSISGLSTKHFDLRGSSAASDLSFSPSTDTLAALVIKDGGNVGVGTTSPDTKLDIEGSAPELRLTDTAGYSWDIGTDGAGGRFKIERSTVADAFVINSSGNVGIGTASPSSLLTIGGNPTALNSTTLGIQITDTNTSGSRGLISTQLLANPSSASSAVYYGGYFNAGSSGGNAQNFTNLSGLVGATGSVSHRGTGTVTGAMSFLAADASNTGGGTITSQYGLYVPNLTAATNNYSIYTGSAQSYFGANVGIGDTTPDAKLEILSTTEQLRLSYADGTVDSRFTVDSSGNLFLDNTGAFTVVSDDLSVVGGDLYVNSASGVADSIVIGSPTAYSSDSNDGILTIYGEQSGAVNYALLQSTGTNFIISGVGQEIMLNPSNAVYVLSGKVLSLFDATNTYQTQLNQSSSTNVNLNVVNSGNTTATILNSGAGTASLNLSDGDLQSNSVVRMTNAGALQNITTLNTSGIITAGAVGTADNSTYLCRNSTNQIATCNSSGAGVAFVQGGNTFGATATLGTNDSYNLAFETGGTTKWIIDTNGHLLPNVDDTYDIGSNTARVRDLYLGPASLHIGTSNTDEYGISYDTTNNTLEVQAKVDSVEGFQILDTDGGTPIFNVDTTNEYVGIGNALPQTKLHITGIANNGSQGIWLYDIQGRGVEITPSNGATGYPYIGSNTNDPFTIGTNNNESMRFLTNGNVGIGDTTPNARLEISNIGSDTNPLVINTNGSAGNYTPTNSGIFIKDAAGAEMLRIFASDPDSGHYNSGNLYIGRLAGFSNPTDNSTAGYSNTGIGDQALYYNTTGDYNTALGQVALESNTTGDENVATSWSLRFNTTGSFNSAYGSESLFYNTIGSYNSALGTDALKNSGKTVTAGSFVSGMQYTIQSSGTTDFTLIGAANSNVGTVFTATGAGTGTGTAASSTHYNTAAGSDALLDSIVGSNNTALGYNTGRGITTGSANTIIGANVTGLSANLSNNIILADGAGNQRINVGSTGLVGIGDTTPDYKLDVEDTSTSTAAVGYSAANATLFVAPASASNTGFTAVSGTAIVTSGLDYIDNVVTGVSGSAQNQSATGTALILRGLAGQVVNDAAGTIGTSYAIQAHNAALNAGTITANYGLYVSDQTAGTSDYGIAIAGADTQVLWLSSGADNTDAANGIAFGSSRDTNLYRSAANTLKTDDSFVAGNGLTVTTGGATISAGGVTVSAGGADITGTLVANNNVTFSGLIDTGADRQTVCSSGAGVLTVDAAGNNCDTSSARFKHDINEIEINGLELVKAMNPKSFVYNSDEDEVVRWGFIAEDMADIDPHFGVYDDQGQVYSIYKYAIMAALADATQELDAKVDLNKLNGDEAIELINSSIDTTNTSLELLTTKVDDIDTRVTSLESNNIAQGLWNGGVVTEDTEFAANVTFNAITTFNGQSVFTGGSTFNGPVNINGVLSVNNSSNSGSAIIPAGSTTTHITFAIPHSGVPKVSATPKTLGQFNFAVQNVTASGFDIVITPSQTTNVEFDWLAI